MKSFVAGVLALGSMSAFGQDIVNVVEKSQKNLPEKILFERKLLHC